MSKINDLMTTVHGKAAKASWTLKKNSPKMMLIMGIGGTVAATVTAFRAGMKTSKIMDEHNRALDAIEKCKETGHNAEGEVYTDEDATADIKEAKKTTIVAVTKVVAPTVAFMGSSVAAQILGFKEMGKRLGLVAAAYAAKCEKLDRYRGYVREELGDKRERELFNGIKATEVTEMTGKFDADGNEIIKKHNIVVADDDDYTALFDESSSEWENDIDYNMTTLKFTQSFMNKLLKARNGAPVFLNEVREKLGLKPTQIGQVTGWVYDPSRKDIDNQIDFGISDLIRSYENGEEMPYDNGIVLEFNVDGNVMYAL